MVESHFHGLYSSEELCCEGPWFTSIQEDGCDNEANQLYRGTEKNTPVIPNWFQPYQCCCYLRYPGEYLGLRTLISYNWTQVLEACDSLKLLSIYFHLCVDATGVVCHQLGLLSTDLYAIDCGGFVEMFTNFASSSSSPAKPSMSPAHSALDLQPAIWICMPVELSVQFSSLIIWVIIGTWQMIIHPIAHWTLISTERLQPATLETKDRGGVGRKNGPCPSQNSIR